MSVIDENRPGGAAAQIDFGLLRSLLGFNIRMAQNAMYRHFTASMEPLNLRQREFAVLELIGQNAGISQVELAISLSVDRPAMMVVVDRLQGRQLLVRRRSKRDRRRQELHLTAKGTELLARAKTIVLEHDRAFTSLFGGAEAAQLIARLQTIAGYLGD
jgi:MarR family transcriptional regulator, organic hydroperoxide resistance regulator